MSPTPSEESERPEGHWPDHYIFAHVALRQLAFENPLGMLGLLASPDSTDFIARLCRDIHKQAKDEPGSKPLHPDTIVTHRLNLAGRPCAAIEMPPPVGRTEVHYIAVVLLADVSLYDENIDEVPQEVRDAGCRYFTLEHGVNEDGEPRTVLGEWTDDGTHLNYGSGPDVNLREFLSTISETAQLGDIEGDEWSE